MRKVKGARYKVQGERRKGKGARDKAEGRWTTTALGRGMRKTDGIAAYRESHSSSVIFLPISCSISFRSIFT